MPLQKRGGERRGKKGKRKACLFEGALPHHADDRARGHVLDEGREELLALEIGVVLLKKLGGSLVGCTQR